MNSALYNNYSCFVYYNVQLGASGPKSLMLNEELAPTSISVRPTAVNAGESITVEGITEQAKVEIISMSGATISKQDIQTGSTVTAPNKAGTYILRVIENGKTSTHKIIVK